MCDYGSLALGGPFAHLELLLGVVDHEHEIVAFCFEGRWALGVSVRLGLGKLPPCPFAGWWFHVFWLAGLLFMRRDTFWSGSVFRTSHTRVRI